MQSCRNRRLFFFCVITIHLIFKQLCGFLLTTISLPLWSIMNWFKVQNGAIFGIEAKKRSANFTGLGHTQCYKWIISENKWNKQNTGCHEFISDGGLVVPWDTSESKFISIQIRSTVFTKYLLLDVFLFAVTYFFWVVSQQRTSGKDKNTETFLIHCFKAWSKLLWSLGKPSDTVLNVVSL